MEYVYDSNWDGKEVWAIIKPDGKHADFYESSMERAIYYMLGEAMAQDVESAIARGYSVKRIKP